MKIKPEHFKILKDACEIVIAKHPDTYAQYQAEGLSNMRFNWDVLHASCIEGVSGNAWICRNLYDYLNDEHINTALARILGNDGTNRHGKKG